MQRRQHIINSTVSRATSVVGPHVHDRVQQRMHAVYRYVRVPAGPSSVPERVRNAENDGSRGTTKTDRYVRRSWVGLATWKWPRSRLWVRVSQCNLQWVAEQASSGTVAVSHARADLIARGVRPSLPSGTDDLLLLPRG